MSGYDCRNGCVFSLRRNIVSDGAVVMCSGRLFRSLGPAVANDRSPSDSYRLRGLIVRSLQWNAEKSGVGKSIQVRDGGSRTAPKQVRVCLGGNRLPRSRTEHPKIQQLPVSHSPIVGWLLYRGSGLTRVGRGADTALALLRP